MDSNAIARPIIRCQQKQLAFERQARALGLRPNDPWVGGYLDYEWEHLRLVLDAMPLHLPGMAVLEFGCNVGASAILLAHLGARVCATDISAGWVELARLNAERYGIGDIDFLHVPDSRRLPFADSQFQLIACNSVLEYVAPEQLPAVQRELDRVLAPGGLLLLSGTSNRLWPREAHTERWLINYLPRTWQPSAQRGIWPWTARHSFGAHYDNLDTAGADHFFARSRRRMGASPSRLLPLLWLARALRVGPGLLTHNLSCLLRKRRQHQQG